MEAALNMDGENATGAYGSLSTSEFRRRVHYMRGHLDAVERMVDRGAECSEVLRQMRAVRRASEKLETYCLMSYIDADVGNIPPGSVHAITDLYRKVNR